MACYDCEDCSKHIDNGGKCSHFEYNCPFTTVEKYDTKNLQIIRNVVQSMLETVAQLNELDTDDCMEDEISSISFQLSFLEEKISEETEKEWNQIKGDELA